LLYISAMRSMIANHEFALAIDPLTLKRSSPWISKTITK
jgi:hypothetical protein